MHLSLSSLASIGFGNLGKSREGEDGRVPCANPFKDAHTALHAAVLAAYGFSAKKDLLAQLLALNLELAQHIVKGEAVTAPGIPASFPKPETLISEDCIRPPAAL